MAPATRGMAAAAAEVRAADWLPILRTHLSRHLVEDGAVQRLGALWHLLPGNLLTAIELRLTAGATRVDSAVRLVSPDQLRELPAQVFPRDRRNDLERRWCELGHPAPVSALWLEFDLDEGSAGPSSPLLCARLTGRSDPGWLVDELFPALHGRALETSQAEAVRRAVVALPTAGHLLYAFSLRPRSEAVRLELFGLGPDAWGPYLEAVASPELARRVASLAPSLRGADRYHLSFDIEDGVQPRVGVECGWWGLPEREAGWRRCLDRWVTAGLAAPERRGALLSWPGVDTLRSEPRRWPEGALRHGGHLVRCLSHFKLVSRPEREPEAKAYLLFQHLGPERQEERSGSVSSPRSGAIASLSRT